MEIFEGHRALFRPLHAPAVAIGNFDGVHLGHLRLLDTAARAARALGGDAVVFTFEPHPAVVLAPHKAPPLLTSQPRKLELLAQASMDACVIEPFTRELADLSPEAFLQSILVEILGARHIVVGYDFTYGRDRAGTTESLRAFGAARGIGVGSGLAAAGLVLVGVAPAPAAAVGLALAATGVSVCWPMLLAYASQGRERPAGVVSGVTATGYIGFVVGPALIGGLAEGLGLRAAVIALAVVAAGVALAPARVTPARPSA